MENKINIEAKERTQEIIVREGKAQEVRDPRIINQVGILDTPALWLKYRKDTIDQKKCNVVVDREAMTISLTVNETDHFNATLTGQLEIHPNFLKFGINSGDYLTNFEMSDLFKMNRSCFENKDVAMKLVSELQGFKAKVNKEIEKADNNRGDVKAILAQTVESNLPDAFRLSMPIFKGLDKQTFEVEVYIRASDLCCTLVSPEANDLIEAFRDTEIDKVLDEIRETCPEIVIIEK